MKRNFISILRPTVTALLVAAAVAGCKSDTKTTTAAQTQPATQTKPAAKVNPAQVQAIAAAPTPPASAQQRTSIGTGKAMINTADSPNDTDSCWVQQLDIDGDGDMEQTTLLWDDENRVLFAYAETTVPCEMGGTAAVAVLIAVNGKGNTHGAPQGSGFYVVYLDATECGAVRSGLFGCRFNAQGNATNCGAIIINDVTDDVTIVDASNGN